MINPECSNIQATGLLRQISKNQLALCTLIMTETKMAGKVEIQSCEAYKLVLK
jgi:hypothetical protein